MVLKKFNNHTVSNTSIFSLGLPGIPKEKAELCVGGRNMISVCVLGQERSGKTSIVRRITGHRFPELYIPTLYDSYVKHTTLRGEDVVIDVKDMSGSIHMPGMERHAVNNANVVLIVFSLANFDSCQYAVKKCLDFEATGLDVPVIIIGNKSDLYKGSESNKKKIEVFIADTVNRDYIEMSAKYDRNTDLLLKHIYEEYEISRGPYRITRAKSDDEKRCCSGLAIHAWAVFN